MTGIKAIWRQDCFVLPTEREAFGFRDGISHPAVEGSGIPGSNPKEPPLKAGEIVLGYQDESEVSAMPQPEVLGRNGTYVVLRKLHPPRAIPAVPESELEGVRGEELLAAKMMGRWRSGCPLALCPERDDPELGADPKPQQRLLLRGRPIGVQDTARLPAGGRIPATASRRAART